MNVSMYEVLELLELPIPTRNPGLISCPFHLEDTPSCAVYEDHFHCYGCGENGSPLHFVAKYLGGSYHQARQWLESGIDVEGRPERPAPKPAEPIDMGPALRDAESRWRYAGAVAYCDEKWPHLSLVKHGGAEALWWLAHTFDVRVGRSNLLIPHRDTDGVIRGVKTRSFYGAEHKGSLEGSTYRHLYRALKRPHPAHSWPKAIVLCEGESDTWSLTFRYHPHGVQVLGLPAGAGPGKWRSEWADKIRLSGAPVYVAFDHDEAGEATANAVWEQVPGLRYLDFPGVYKDVTEATLKGHQWPDL